MKFFSSIILALLALASFAKADRILIYQGSEIREVNDTPYWLKGRSHYIRLFDLDTLQTVAIEYGGSNAAQKYYSVGGTDAFVYAPITAGATASQTYFARGSTSTGASFDVNYESYSGNNVSLALGGSFTGDFPRLLIFERFAGSGDGTTTSDLATQYRGTYHYAPGMTQESNAANDALTAAVAIVTTTLTNVGFVAE